MKNMPRPISKVKKVILILFTLLSLSCFLSACSNNTQEDAYTRAKRNNQLVWGCRPDTRLFGLTNIKTGEIQGFEIDMAKAITKKVLGSKAKCVLRPISEKTRITLLHNGSLDCVISTMTITKEREKVIDFSKIYFNAGESMLVKKTSPYKKITDLNKRGVVVIAIKGTDVPNVIKKYAPKATVKQFDDYGSAFNALKAGQGDCMIDDNGILAGLIADDKSYTLTGGTFTSEPYGIGVEKGQTKLRKKINQAIGEMRKNGQYDKLVKKWFGSVSGFDVKQAESTHAVIN